jgi:hypothetical protein
VPDLIIKKIKGGAEIDRIKVSDDTTPRTAAKTMKGLMMRVDRDRFCVDDSELEKHFGEAYVDALSSLAR